MAIESAGSTDGTAIAMPSRKSKLQSSGTVGIHAQLLKGQSLCSVERGRLRASKMVSRTVVQILAMAPCVQLCGRAPALLKVSPDAGLDSACPVNGLPSSGGLDFTLYPFDGRIVTLP